VAGLNFLVLKSSPKSVVGDPEPKRMDSRQQSAGMTKKGQPCPELGRRVASLYQDKEDRKKVNTNEEEAYKDSVLELLDIDSNDRFQRNKRDRGSDPIRCRPSVPGNIRSGAL
jgi:hypothetical protein